MKWMVKIGQITQTAQTIVEAPDQAAAEEKAMDRIGDTTEYTVVMNVRELDGGGA